MTAPGARDQASCLVQKLSHYMTLTARDRELLATMEKSTIDVGRGVDVVQGDRGHDYLYVVKSGWLYDFVDLPDGRRTITRIHHPGDVIGLADVPAEVSPRSVRTCEGVQLCPFPRSALAHVFEQSPPLASLFFALLAREHLALVDRVRAVARMSARERVGHLLVELMARLRIGDACNGTLTTTSFRLPLNQTEIGDALGLTNVTVSKTLNQMENDELIRRFADRIELRQEHRLRHMCDFVDRYASMRTDWLPIDMPAAAE